MNSHLNAAYDLTVRQAQPADLDALRRLALLDSRPARAGERMAGAGLVAEADGEVIAAMPLSGGPEIADPFRPTAGAVELLRTRSGQFRGRAA